MHARKASCPLVLLKYMSIPIIRIYIYGNENVCPHKAYPITGKKKKILIYTSVFPMKSG
jgi:hypothetical protein